MMSLSLGQGRWSYICSKGMILWAAAEKVQLAFISMDRPAVRWFRFSRKKMPGLAREGLTEALIQRFGQRSLDSVYEL